MASGDGTPLTRGAINALRRCVAGSITLPGDEDYHLRRAVWNATVDRHPAAIVSCGDADDAAAALAWAQAEQLLVAVRGGAHNYPGFSTCDDGIKIDLSAMRSVTVDPASKRAVAQGGALLGHLDEATQAYGLACPNGAVSHTGYDPDNVFRLNQNILP